tara:strand:+ start:37 stop:483 length:447 start_codon:yes stop_codon:yes gene_type:complete
MPRNRYCRNKKGGQYNIPKPTVSNSSLSDAVQSSNETAKNEAELTVEENKLLKGGSNSKFTPMDQADPIQNENNKKLIELTMQSQEDSKYDNPPKIGGRRRRKTKKKKFRKKRKSKRKTKRKSKRKTKRKSKRKTKRKSKKRKTKRKR